MVLYSVLLSETVAISQRGEAGAGSVPAEARLTVNEERACPWEDRAYG